MHQPVLDPASPLRRSSFGVEATLKAAPGVSDTAQAFKEMLLQPNRPVPSRRASLRATPHAPSFAPPPPPISVAAQVVDAIRPAPMLDSLPLHATPMRPPSPLDPTRSSAARKVHHSPVRSPVPAPPPPPPPPPPSMSSPPRGNSSQAEYFMRSNGLSPPSASRRAYSFVRDQSLRPPVAGQHRAPPRTSSCPPDADILKTRMMRSNSDGYTSASTSFMTECSTSPTSSGSSNPSDNEEPIDPRHHLHDKKTVPECYPSSFNPAQLELESRRRDLLWRETEKQWKDKHGNTRE